MNSVQLTPEQLNARNRRNVFIALGLVAFIVLIFTTTFLRMQRNLAERNAQPVATSQGVAVPAETPRAG